MSPDFYVPPRPTPQWRFGRSLRTFAVRVIVGPMAALAWLLEVIWSLLMPVLGLALVAGIIWLGWWAFRSVGGWWNAVVALFVLIGVAQFLIAFRRLCRLVQRRRSEEIRARVDARAKEIGGDPVQAIFKAHQEITGNKP